MNLTTHAVLGFAIGLAVFHNFQAAVITALGALIPDLDREYLFVAKDKIGRYQLHRSLFHNFFFLGFLFFAINPFLGVGALSHSLVDALTTPTDRGVELFFPLTRIYRGFLWSIDGDGTNQNSSVKWWVEDPWGLLEKTSDRDLSEPGHQPWRRTYGPFKNSRIADWGLFFASAVFSLILLAISPSSYSILSFDPRVLISALGISIFYILGEWWRRKSVAKETVASAGRVTLAFLVLGLAVLVFGLGFIYHPFVTNYVSSLMFYALISSVVGLAASYLLVRFRQKGKGEITL